MTDTATAHHGPSLQVYVTIFVCLLIGTALTVYAATKDLGPLNNIVMLGIAITKATLVILYFMHVRYGPRLIWVLAGSGFAWLAIFVAFTVADYVTRGPVL
jgi:cytochrome c oxidase subunit IV